MSPQRKTSGPSAATVRVAVITPNFWPEPTGGSPTVTEFAEYLAHAGCSVEVATSVPYYPQWQIWPEYRGRLWLAERHGGMLIRRSWHYIRPNPTTLARILSELTMSLMALPSMVRVLRRADVVYVVSPALGFAFVGMMVTRLFRVRRILIVKDVMPDAAIELGMMKSRWMIRLSRWLARRVYQAAHEIHTLGDGMVKRIAQLTDDRSKIRIVVDTIDPDELAPVPVAENRFRRQFVPEGTFAVLHTGNMGKKQDLDLLLRAADRLRGDPRFRFYVFGEGVCKDQFMARRAELKLTNVEHHPLQDRAMLRHMLSGADVVLVSQLPEVVDVVFPSKLVTSLSAGAMIVVAAAPESEAARAVVRTGAGLTVPASDDSALVAALQSIADGKVDTANCRRRARSFALGTFGRDVVYGPIARELLGGAAVVAPHTA